MTITVHSLVKNEGRFVWYAVMSVIDYVDRVLLWDSGSTDGTVEVLKEIKKVGGRKIDLRQIGEITPQEFTAVRQQMLDGTTTDWFIVVDGDEIWWDKSIKEVVDTIGKRGNKIESIVLPTINPVGDIFHFQEQMAGQYQLAGHRGHFNLRAVNRNIPGLHSQRPHGSWGWADSEGKMIQDRDPQKIVFVNAPYLHATFLVRSVERAKDYDVPKRANKLKYELGIPFLSDFLYPEVLFRPRPPVVGPVWEKRTLGYTLRAAIETPFKMARRRILPVGKAGY